MRKLSNWQRTINRNNRKDANNQNNSYNLKDGKSIQGSPLKVYTSNNKFDFMVISPDSPDIPPFQSRISTPKIDKTIKKIQQLNATPSSSNSPIVYNRAPRGETKVKECEPIASKQDRTQKKPQPTKPRRNNMYARTNQRPPRNKKTTNNIK